MKQGNKTLGELIHASAELIEHPLPVKNHMRDILFVALLKNTEYKQNEIARHFNMKNYANVSRAYDRGKSLLEESKELRKKYLMIAGGLFSVA